MSLHKLRNVHIVNLISNHSDESLCHETTIEIDPLGGKAGGDSLAFADDGFLSSSASHLVGGEV